MTAATNPTPDEHHSCRLEREPTGPRLSRAVWVCSWRSEWTPSTARAVDYGLAHTAAAERATS